MQCMKNGEIMIQCSELAVLFESLTDDFHYIVPKQNSISGLGFWQIINCSLCMAIECGPSPDTFVKDEIWEVALYLCEIGSCRRAVKCERLSLVESWQIDSSILWPRRGWRARQTATDCNGLYLLQVAWWLSFCPAVYLSGPQCGRLGQGNKRNCWAP